MALHERLGEQQRERYPRLWQWNFEPRALIESTGDGWLKRHLAWRVRVAVVVAGGKRLGARHEPCCGNRTAELAPACRALVVSSLLPQDSVSHVHELVRRVDRTVQEPELQRQVEQVHFAISHEIALEARRHVVARKPVLPDRGGSSKHVGVAQLPHAEREAPHCRLLVRVAIEAVRCVDHPEA